MKELKRKIERFKPIIKIRKTDLDREAVCLSKIRSFKREAMENLKKFQTQYMEGVSQLNEERQSKDRGKLASLERGVDYSKNRWHESLAYLRQIEIQERAQIAQVLKAERDLKSIEKLTERYVGQLKEVEDKEDQAVSDEAALRGHGGGR